MNVTTYISGATLSRCHQYRYHLWRKIEPPVQEVLSGCAVRAELQRERAAGRGTCLFIMLNPSTADQTENDPTVSRCVVRAGMMGFQRLEVCNIFALRSTDPKALYRHPAPIGVDNDGAILEAARAAEMTVCGWGEHGTLHGRGAQVLKMLRDAGVTPHALKINESGNPCHPLYLPYSLQPEPMP